jgi:hypothetical protein
LKEECDDWYGRNLDAKEREDSLKCINADTRLALIEEGLQEQSKELAEQRKELAEQSKELAETNTKLTLYFFPLALYFVLLTLYFVLVLTLSISCSFLLTLYFFR